MKGPTKVELAEQLAIAGKHDARNMPFNDLLDVFSWRCEEEVKSLGAEFLVESAMERGRCERSGCDDSGTIGQGDHLATIDRYPRVLRDRRRHTARKEVAVDR